MKRHLGPAEVRPLRHRLQVIDRFRRFDLNRTGELVGTIRAGKNEIRINLHGSYLYGHCLVAADVHGDLVPALQARLQQPYDAIVLELLAHRSNENGAHGASQGENNAKKR